MSRHVHQLILESHFLHASSRSYFYSGQTTVFPLPRDASNQLIVRHRQRNKVGKIDHWHAGTRSDGRHSSRQTDGAIREETAPLWDSTDPFPATVSLKMLYLVVYLVHSISLEPSPGPTWNSLVPSSRK
jgi:hypothetical protein